MMTVKFSMDDLMLAIDNPRDGVIPNPYGLTFKFLVSPETLLTIRANYDLYVRDKIALADSPSTGA